MKPESQIEEAVVRTMTVPCIAKADHQYHATKSPLVLLFFTKMLLTKSSFCFLPQWLGGGEIPSGFSGLEGYTGGEGAQDLHASSQAPAAHQLVSVVLVCYLRRKPSCALSSQAHCHHWHVGLSVCLQASCIL